MNDSKIDLASLHSEFLDSLAFVGEFKQVEPLTIDGVGSIDKVAHLWTDAQFSATMLYLNQSLLAYDDAVRLRDWLIAATGGQGPEGWKLVPVEPPDSIPAEGSGNDFDQELFELCRKDDYRGLYKALIARTLSPSQPGGTGDD